MLNRLLHALGLFSLAGRLAWLLLIAMVTTQAIGFWVIQEKSKFDPHQHVIQLEIDRIAYWYYRLQSTAPSERIRLAETLNRPGMSVAIIPWSDTLATSLNTQTNIPSHAPHFAHQLPEQLTTALQQPIVFELMTDLPPGYRMTVPLSTGQAMQVQNNPFHSPLPLHLLREFVVKSLAIIVVCFVLIRLLVVRPLRQLANETLRFGQTLHIQPITAPALHELQPLITALNTMQATIQRQFTQQKQFLAAVSHDLRTPIGVMKMRVAMLDDTELQHTLDQDLDEMHTLVENTLMYFKDTHHVPEQAKRIFSITAVLQETIVNWAAQGTQIIIQSDPVPDITWLGFEMDLKRVFNNLIENAARYGAPPLWLIITQPTEHDWQIILEDHGEGIPDQLLETVLQPFIRVDSSRNRNTGGSGLGLAIAQELLKRNGLTLSLSRATGHQGLRVTIAAEATPEIAP
jgi:signal transduction histidine kinase